jgi:hypothetical protein
VYRLKLQNKDLRCWPKHSCRVTVGFQDKAKAANKLPPIHIAQQRQAKTGIADVPENFSTNFSRNPIKINKDTVKSCMDMIYLNKVKKNVNPCKSTNLQKVTVTRPAGFEPATYGLEKLFSDIYTCPAPFSLAFKSAKTGRSLQPDTSRTTTGHPTNTTGRIEDVYGALSTNQT